MGGMRRNRCRYFQDLAIWSSVRSRKSGKLVLGHERVRGGGVRGGMPSETCSRPYQGRVRKVLPSMVPLALSARSSWRSLPPSSQHFGA